MIPSPIETAPDGFLATRIFFSSKTHYTELLQTNLKIMLSDTNRWNSCSMAFIFAVALTGSAIECELDSELALRDIYFICIHKIIQKNK